ncbi:glycosyltransferase family 4 protein, partial [Candidatus Parcubacteria bacterium]|nr:glycosyltransferase family 4 protein [Candidatus Parcubacteria bacterium]
EEKLKQILYIGRIEAKKNILNLIKAFEIFNKKYNDYNLILAGKIDEDYVKKNINLFNQDNIKLLGYISNEEKFKLLRESRCLAFVPFEEGFGIPILEAFDFNLPVVCSDIPVLHEVGGDACIFVDAENINQIAENLEKIVIDENLRNNLIEKGQQQLEKFSWQKTGERYLEEILK